MVRVLFLGSGPFGVPILERLAELAGDALEVGTVPDARRGRAGQPSPTIIKARSLELNLPCHEVATLKGEHGKALLQKSACGLVIVADFRLILPGSFLRAPERACYNVHASLLPLYRGAAPVARSILDGDFRFGVSLCRMGRDLDAGPVVARRVYDPGRKQSTPEVESKLSHMGATLVASWLSALAAGLVPLEEQDSARATFAPKLRKEEGWVAWERSAASIENQTLALKPWPRTFTRLPSRERNETARWFLDEASPGSVTSALPPGTIRTVGETGIEVACGPDGAETIRLLRIQRAGKRSLPVHEFLRGMPLSRGERFQSAPLFGPP